MTGYAIQIFEGLGFGAISLNKIIANFAEENSTYFTRNKFLKALTSDIVLAVQNGNDKLSRNGLQQTTRKRYRLTIGNKASSCLDSICSLC